MFNAKVLIGGVLLSMSATSFASGECESTSLHEGMESLKTEMKSLSFDIKKGEFEQADERVDTVLQLLHEAREETPYLFKEKGLQGDELAQRQADYQSVMDDTIETFEALSVALEKGDSSQVKSMLKEVGDLRKKGHRAFKADC